MKVIKKCGNKFTCSSHLCENNNLKLYGSNFICIHKIYSLHSLFTVVQRQQKENRSMYLGDGVT
jgi:hypothetical protein